jgi:hypothetical protein
MAELDLAYLFMQPYRSAAAIDRPAVQSFYWQERARLGGGGHGYEYTGAERCFRQRHADAVLALRQLIIAYHVALAPFPAGSAPHTYWQEMFAVLEERLREMCGSGE